MPIAALDGVAIVRSRSCAELLRVCDLLVGGAGAEQGQPLQPPAGLLEPLSGVATGVSGSEGRTAGLSR